jgi:hypothetical protein
MNPLSSNATMSSTMSSIPASPHHHPYSSTSIYESSSHPNTFNMSSADSIINYNNTILSVECPLPPTLLRALGDRSYDKRKNAALEIESIAKSLQESNNVVLIHSVISVLSKDFSTSMNAQLRKGGLIGLAATAIGLMQHTSQVSVRSLLF